MAGGNRGWRLHGRALIWPVGLLAVGSLLALPWRPATAAESPAPTTAPTQFLPLCTTVGRLPALPAPAASTLDADRLVAAKQYDAAQRLYRARLDEDPTDACAARGLARIAELRQAEGDAAAKAKARAKSRAQRAAEKWDDFYADWLAPASRLVLPFLALLGFLLVLARLLTPFVVGVRRVSPSPRASRARWWVGSTLLALVAAAVVVASWFRLVPIDWTTLLLAVGAILTAAGLVLVASGRGHRLSLVVEASKADGTTDQPAARYVVGRLQALGSEPPSGLEVPQQTDVTELPDEALTTLPQGRVAVVAFQVLRVLRPAAPWHAAVTAVGTDAVTVTLTRNGRLAESATITRSDLALPVAGAAAGEGAQGAASDASGSADVDVPRALLTAAAAFVLVTLAERHRELQPGLCGASRWRSVACQVLAAEVGEDSALGRRLAARAVEADGANAAARVAYIHRFGRRSDDHGDQKRFADLMSEEYARQLRAPLSPRGMGALQIRMLYSLAAARLNCYLLGERAADWRAARSAGYRLVHRLAPTPDRADPLRGFVVDEMRPAAAFVWQGVVALKPAAVGDDRLPADITDLANAWARGEDAGPMTLTAYYDRACTRAESATTDDVRSLALDDLEIAVDHDGLRTWARKDPSLRVFRADETTQTLRSRYRSIVGDPAPSSFLRLAPLEPYADTLQAVGVHDADDVAQLLERPLARHRLAAYLGVDAAVLDRWLRIIGLSRFDAGIETPTLALLLAVGIDSVDRLRARLSSEGDAAALHAGLAAAAADLAVVPPTGTDVDRWAALLAPCVDG